MRYPDAFYFSEAQGKEIYTRTPTGNLSVGKLIKGEPCWRAPALPRIEKPKSLILADWTAAYWSSEKIDDVKQILAELLTQRFSIYIWKNGQVTAMNPELLPTLVGSFDKQITPGQEIIKAAVIQNKLTSDQIQLIDDYWIDHLLSQKQEPGPRILRTSELKNLNPDDLALLIQISNAARPKLTKIIHDEFSGSANQTAGLFQAQCPDIQIEYDYTTLVHDESGDYSVSGQYSLDKFVIKLDDAQLKKLRHIRFHPSSPTKYVVSILENTADFKQLEFIKCKNLADKLIPNPAGLSKLESLDLSSSDISGQTLQALLKIAPNLKILNLSYCNNLADILTLTAASLSKLESLDISGSNISAKNLPALLQNTLYLKTLHLSYCNNLADILTFIPASLLKLESLNLSGSNISAQNLPALLQANPKLKILHLRDCQNLADTLTLIKDSLSELAFIDLSGSHISAQNLQVLLQNTPHLKTLNLTYCRKSADILTAASLAKLKSLESLDLSGSNISAQNLPALLQATPQLKTLYLRDCQNLAEPLRLTPASLSRLESLDLSESNISAQNLQALLQAAPKLKTLNLCNCKKLVGELKLGKNSLFELEFIDITNSHISSENLQALLQAAPNLNQQTKDMIEKICRERETTRLHTSARARSVFFDPSERDLGLTQASSALNPIHHPQDMKDFVPNQEPFTFKGTNTTKNQGMIIEKLSQYLTLRQEQLDLIPRIQDGICNALSHYFLAHPNWPHFIDMTLAWDGRTDINPELQTQFNELLVLIRQHQFTTRVPAYYVGDTLAVFLKDQRRPCILSNPWHAIAIKPTENGNWHVYDPNYVTGYLEIAPQALLDSIKTSIGAIVSVKAATSATPCAISDPNQFIGHGGLLALCQCGNAQEMLSQLSQKHSYSKAALDGLLLRDIKGTPAWIRGLASPNPAIKALTQALKAQLEQQNSQNSVAQLAKSIEALAPQKKGELITSLVQTSTDAHGQNALIEAIRVSDNRERFSKALETWDKTAADVSNPIQYFQQCCTNPPKKQLIELDSSQHVDTLLYHLEQYANTVKRPVFYIDHPNDLICSAPWISKNKDNTGSLCKGPGGPLYEFLQAHQHDMPLLIVNYERFNADDIVRFNGLLDEKPQADGTPLPANTQVIGLINRNKPDCYQGSDFYSRFNHTQRCPLTHAMLDDLQPRKIVDIVPVTVCDETDSTTINLYHAADWEDRLLGRWVLNGDNLSFEEGELVKAIAAGKTIEIQNGLWGDEKFERFWQQAMTLGVRHTDRIIQIPQDINITRPETDTYAWGKWLGITNISTALLEGPDEILNPSNLTNFLERYALKAGHLCKEPGLIAAHKSSAFTVLLTATLTDDAWAMLLDKCQQQQVTLNIHPAPGVELPAAFQHSVIKPAEVDFSKDITNGLIISSDIDTTVAMINSKHDYIVIDVSECTPADLLYKLDGKLNPESMKFEFRQTDSALTTALAEKKKIILKGHFSAELMDALTPIILNREHQLILISDDNAIGSFMPQRYTHSVSVEEKLACLGEDVSIQPQILAEKPLSTLKALLSAGYGDDPWVGMYALKGPTQAFTAKLAHATSAEFTQSRIDKVNQILSQKPYVFLSGLSGVGKSTFVERVFCTEDDALYLTEDNIEQWAMDTSEKRKILFIDEANLSPRQWSEFEGLYQKPPHILVNGKLHALASNHKVIFAGNPVNYGDERRLAPFFQRHGNAVLFEPLPPTLIAEQILTPVFQNTGIEPGPIIDRILAVYSFICDCSTTDILISPRELQMMALLTITRAREHPEQDINAIAEHFTYQLAINLLQIEKRRKFDAHFKPKTPITIALPETTDQAFHVTPSRQAVSQQLSDLMALRKWRRGEEATLSSQQKTGGLGGIIIEGEPGIGKSQLVIATLRAWKYEEEHDLTTTSSKENPFYIMPVSMPLSEKEHLLIKAFNEGAIVMIDEINSSPMMERLLNDLLMGKNPKGKPDDVVKPGFMIIGTQNPVTMAGRRAASNALLRRVVSTTLPEYEPDEIGHILRNKAVPARVADDMITAYKSKRAYALQNRLSPVPNFRHLMTLVDQYLESQQAKRATKPRALLEAEEPESPSRSFGR